MRCKLAQKNKNIENKIAFVWDLKGLKVPLFKELTVRRKFGDSVIEKKESLPESIRAQNNGDRVTLVLLDQYRDTI